MKTQHQLWQDAEAKSASINRSMMEMMQNDEITNDELAALIKKRPEVYGRFSGFVGKLKEAK